MPLNPAINSRVNITAVDINGNSVAKAFNFVASLDFDYAKGMVTVVDRVQGAFQFSLLTITTLTYTVVSGAARVTTVVMS